MKIARRKSGDFFADALPAAFNRILLDPQNLELDLSARSLSLGNIPDLLVEQGAANG
jgi:hypothetical protein